MAKRKKHRIVLELRNFELPKLKSAVKVTIINDAGKVCTLEFGRGGLVVTQKCKQSGTRFSWEKLAEILESNS